MKACILHSIRDADHCIKTGLYKDCTLFSTHSSADVYLKERYGVECSCLSALFSEREMTDLKNGVGLKVDAALSQLDSSISVYLNDRFNLKINYFFALYGYAGKFHLLGYEFLRQAMTRLLKIKCFNDLLIYDYKFNDNLYAHSHMKDFLLHILPDLSQNVISYGRSRNKGNEAIAKIPCILSTVLRRGAALLRRRLKSKPPILASTRNRFFPHRETVVLQEPLYDLCFLKDELRNFNILYYPIDADFPLGFKARNLWWDHKFNLPDPAKKEDPMSRFFMANIMDDFNSNISRYLKAIDLLRNIHKERKICLGVWGNSPYKGTKALVCEYLRSNKINVIGSQHGAVYGDSYEPWHFDSDFNRCDYFLSYGFCNEDLMRLYPERDIKTEIIPVGKFPQLDDSKRKKCIDILFPITNTISIFGGGTLRTSPHELTQRQISLLRHLDSLQDVSVFVKPFPGSDYGNCSVLPVLNSLKRVNVARDISLIAFLDRYSPRIIVLDLPSTPLYEVIGLDAEIFLMNDEGHPLDGQALAMLEKRVHFFSDENEMAAKISAFLNGEIKAKRDESFRNYYVRRHSKDLLLAFIAKRAHCQ